MKINKLNRSVTSIWFQSALSTSLKEGWIVKENLVSLQMAALRKANSYSKRKVTPFTRVSKKRTKSFIKTLPPHKVVKFENGKKDLKYKAGKISTSIESNIFRKIFK